MHQNSQSTTYQVELKKFKKLNKTKSPYERKIGQSVLDLVRSGISVEAAAEHCSSNKPPDGPTPGYDPPAETIAERSNELLEYRETASQHYYFQTSRQKQSRALWLSVAAKCEPHRKRFRSMLLCGSALNLQHSFETQQYRITSPSCGNRFCPRCSQITSKSQIARVKQIAKQEPRHGLKFMTIAPAHNDRPLWSQVEHLKASFRRLRQRKLFKETYDHGVTVIEIKIAQDGKWHPHLHTICDGKYLKHAILLDLCRATFQSEVSVNVKAVRNPEKATEYLSKYISKGCNNEASLHGDPEKACELYKTLFRLKTCWTWGSTYPKVDQPEPAKREPADDWKTLIGFGQIMLAIKSNNAEVLYWLTEAKAPIEGIKKYLMKRRD